MDVAGTVVRVGMDERVRSKVIELMRAWSRPQLELTEPVGRGLGGDDESDAEGEEEGGEEGTTQSY